MPKKLDPMLFVSITEFGTTDTAYETLLHDLSSRAERLGKPFGHDLMMAFGSIDVIEFTRFDHYFHFAELGSSSAQSFRRSVGAYCHPIPTEASLDPSICTLDDVLQEEGNGGRPFLAVMYLKLSPVPLLAVPPVPNSTLTHRLVERICVRTLPLWQISRSILRQSVGKEYADRCSRELRVAALIGLDAVELILVVRAVCLEQVSALAWALRNQRLGDLWTLEGHPEAAIKMLDLLRAGGEGSQIDEGRLSELWNDSPLFGGTTTVVGMPLRKKRARRGWRLETLDDPRHEAASAAIFTMRTSFLPGKFDHSIKPYGSTIKPYGGIGTSDRSTAAGSGSRNDVQRDAATSAPGEDTVFLMLFDRVDRLVPPEPIDIHGVPNEIVGPRLVCELQARTTELGSLNASDSAKDGVRSHTEIAVRIRVPEDIVSSSPNDLLFKLFRERLRRQRAIHSQRIAKYPGSWTRRWLEAAREKGVVYSATNKILKTINTVLDHLDVDLEGFVDLLPVLGQFVGNAERPETTPEDLLRLLWAIEHITEARCRQDHPLRAPHVSLALEGNAGYRLPRDAFIRFAESVCEVVDPKALLVVRDSSSGGIACSFSVASWDLLRVSTLTLHHPVHWLVAPALAPARLEHTTLGDIERMVPTTSGILHAAFGAMALEIASQESLARLSGRIRVLLRQAGGSSKLSAFFLHTLRHAVSGLISDLCLLRSLRLSGGTPDSAHRLFWFLQGPAFVFFVQYRFGSKIPEPGIIQSLIVRCILVSHVLKPRAGGWLGAMDSSLRQLREDALSMRLDGPSLRPASEITARLQCLKEDLRIPDAAWIESIDLLWESMAYVREHAPNALQIMGAWIAFSRAVEESLFDFPTDLDNPCLLYASYISELVELWGEEADPWLPFTVSHHKDRILLRSFRLKNAPFGPSFLRRGGILVQKSLTDEKGQREYRQITYDFMARLGEFARRSKARKVFNYLGGSSSTEGAIS